MIKLIFSVWKDKKCNKKNQMDIEAQDKHLILPLNVIDMLSDSLENNLLVTLGGN